MDNIKKFFAVAAMSACAASVQAGVITTGTSTTLNPDHVVTFERVGNFNSYEIATTQFTNQGVTFVDHGGDAPILYNNGFCKPSALTSNAYVAFGVWAPCNVGSVTKSVTSLLFSTDVQELSFTYATVSSVRLSSYLFEALLDGNVVSSLSSMPTAFSSTNNTTTFLFTGSVFDELRFTEQGSNPAWFWMDNLSWRSGTTSSNSVSEPASLGLLGLGFMGLYGVRRKRKSV